MIYTLDGTRPSQHFPDPTRAEREPNGLLAIGGDLDPRRIVQAYRQGIFPWFNDGQPILWWSPNPRTVLIPGHEHVARSLRKQLHKSTWQLTMDRAFGAVIQACAGPRRNQPGTWLSGPMQRAYRALHHRGIAHSVEVWQADNLVGGLYGLCIGRVFFGESMFSHASGASKAAFMFLAQQARAWNIELIDGQVYNEYLASLGAQEIPRSEFLTRLQAGLAHPDIAAHAWQEATCWGNELEVVQ